MKDLVALAELFGLEIIEAEPFIPSSWFLAIVETILVKAPGQRDPVTIGLTHWGRFLATDEIGGVPMHFQENGVFRYVIDV